MLRVMLVDDEPMALEGLRLLIDWKQNGFAVAASCLSGAEALRRLPEAQPDLIVTDLFMPQIDGVALIRQAKERGFTGEIIIVSGYSDFEKARQALSLGVAGYILKPVDPEEAAGAIDCARKRLLTRAMRDQRDDRYPSYQPQLIAMLLGRPYDARALPESGEWRLMTWGSPLPIENIKLMQKAAKELGADAIPCILEEREWLVLYAQKSTDAATRRLREKAAALGRTLYMSDALGEHKLLLPARKKLAARLDQYHAQLSKALGELEKTVTLLKEKEFLEQAAALKGFCEARGRRVTEQALAMWRACCARQFEQQPDKLDLFVTESVNARDVRALGYLTMRLLSPQQQRLSDVVIAHAQAHYGENLTLDSLAATLGYNPAYLGRVFREETGVAFRAWLTNLRMQKAADLLRQSQTPMGDIALAVGFQKYKSFLDHFKVAYSVTPDAYRRGGRGGIDRRA